MLPGLVGFGLCVNQSALLDRLNTETEGMSAIFMPSIVCSNAQNNKNVRYKTMKKIIFAAIAIVSLFIVIGSIGAFANDNITAFQCLIQSAIGVGAECFALAGLNK